MAKNNIIYKHFLPQSTLLCVALIAMIAAPFTCAQDVIKSSKTKKTYTAQTCAIAFILALSVIVLCCPYIYSYKKGEKIASNIVRQYITKEMAEHPELKDFKNVLSNPQAMKNIATMVSNKLRPEEQARILDIFNEFDRTNFQSKDAEIAELKKAIKKTTKILEEHAATDPNFITEIYAQMAYADRIYFMPSQQNAR